MTQKEIKYRNLEINKFVNITSNDDGTLMSVIEDVFSCATAEMRVTFFVFSQEVNANAAINTTAIKTVFFINPSTNLNFLTFLVTRS